MYNKINFNKIKMNNNMTFINLSPWPFMLTINSINIIYSNIYNFNNNFNKMWIINLLIMINIMIMWNYNSNNSKIIFGYKNFFFNTSMKMSITMFILSELMFFLTFFYVYFSNKYFNIYFFKKFYLSMFKLNFIMSLMNLIILITSSFTFMIFIKTNKMNKLSQKFIFITMILSIYFIMIQIIEYSYLNFNFTNSIFFSLFYLLTLFHMTHVIMGTLMMINLMINKMILMNNFFIKMIYICWYWHFIDFIWILIFFIIYYFINM